MKNKFWILFLLILVFSVFWSCAQKDPIGIDQYVVEIPTANFLINTSLLTDGDDFSIGYYNGNIQTDQMQMNWTQSTDDDFLCYKVMRMDGEPEERSMEGFEGGTIPANYTTWGDFGGWFVTDEFSYEGNYCARTNEGYYGYEYLETTINVPQNTDIIISFFAAAVNDGEGSFRINGMTYGYWYSNQWQQSYYVYNTGNNNTLSLQWLYYTYDYGFGVIDNIQILGAGSNYETLTTFTDVSSTSITDTLLAQDSYYTYNVVAINNSGGCQQDQITIKTPKWEAPDNILINGLSPEIIEVTWNDNSDSENNFTVYTFMDINTNFELIDSVLVDNDVTGLIIDDLDINEAYLFSVKASNSFENDTILGNSDYFIFNDLVFAQPTDLVGFQIAGSKSINLSWTDNSNLETGFSIERKINNGTFIELATTDMNITEYVDNDSVNMEFEDTLIYRVRAYNDYDDENIIYTNYTNEVTVTLYESEQTRILSYWVQAGPEEVDEDENLDISYYSIDGSWILIRSINYYEADTWTYFEDEIEDVNAMHQDFKIRFQQSYHSGYDCDNWHIDDVSLASGQNVFFEDDFSSGVISYANWQTQDYVNISYSYFHSGPAAIFFDSDDYLTRQIITTNIPW